MKKKYKYSYLFLAFFMLTQEAESMNSLSELDNPEPRKGLRKDVIEFSQDQLLSLLKSSIPIDKLKKPSIKSIDEEAEVLNRNKDTETKSKKKKKK